MSAVKLEFIGARKTLLTLPRTASLAQVLPIGPSTEEGESHDVVSAIRWSSRRHVWARSSRMPMTGNNSKVIELALLGSRVEACRAKDIDRLMSLYSTVYFDCVPPLEFVGSAAVRRDFARLFDQYRGTINLKTHH